MDTRLNGLFTALVTPFNSDGSIDEGAMCRLVDRQIEAGVQGVVPCGTTGEAATMTHVEHQRVVEIVAEHVAGRTFVLAGAGSNDTAAAIDLSRRCADVGANGLLHVTPYYTKPTQAGLIAHYERVAEAIDLPVVLYNVPGRTGIAIQPATALRLAQHPQIVGIKQAVVDLEQLSDILRGRPDDFAVLSGEDSLTLAMIALGADGVISVIGNEAPADFGALVHAALANDFDTARAIQRRLLPLLRANFVESNPIPAKYAMSRLGLIENVLRSPMTPLDPACTARVDAALTEAGLLDEAGVPVVGAGVTVCDNAGVGR